MAQPPDCAGSAGLPVADAASTRAREVRATPKIAARIATPLLETGTPAARAYHAAIWLACVDMPSPFVELEVGERVVKLTNPDKVLFPKARKTKRDLAEYYLAVGEGIVRALYERPTQLRRFPDGVTGEAIYQKRVPEKRPEWVEAARVTFPSGTTCGRALRHRARAGDLGGEPRRRRLPPVAVAAPGHRAPGRAAHRHRPAAGNDVPRRQEGRRARARGARRDRLHGLAQDVGEPRHPRLLPDRAELGVPGRPPLRRSRSPARSSGGCRRR